MSSNRKKQIEAMQDGNEDESYLFMNHRGGGGAPLISARSGNQVTKVGQVIHGGKQINDRKYNGIGSDSNFQDRPKTAFDHRTPTAVQVDKHNLFTPNKSVSASPSVANSGDPNRYRHKKQDRDQDVRQNLPANGAQRVTSGMASLLTDASSYSGAQAPEPIRTKLSRYEEEDDESIKSRKSPQCEEQMPKIGNVRQERNLVGEADPSHHLFSVPVQSKSSTPSRQQSTPVIDLSAVLRGQQDILAEMRAMKEFTAKQAMVKSIRWGLSNLNMVDQATCVGTLGGHGLPPISLSELVKKVLIEFMKCNGCNIGRRSLISARDDGEEGAQKFLEQLYDNVFMLTGVAPDLVRRDDGDYEIYYGDNLAQ